MNIYYYCDENAKRKCNRKGLDYTPAYLPLMLKTLGYTAYPLSPGSKTVLSANDVLFTGAEQIDETVVDQAVGSGCKIVAFASKGSVFPKTEPFTPSLGDYTVTGYFSFSDGTPLPVIGEVLKITDADAEVLGTFSAKEGTAPSYAVKNGVYYFGFDLPGTLWHAADGTPTIEPKQQYVPYGRVPDGYVIPLDYDYSIPYADVYLSYVANILSSFGFVRVFELPVKDGDVYDTALYFAGDDDATSEENDMAAARVMNERGLPYHINLMPADDEGNFVITRKQVEELHKLGCETDLHFDFTRFEYSERGYKMQRDMYYKAFGEEPFSPVNHCLIQVGAAADRYRFQAECGCKSDNNRFQGKPDPVDINAFNLNGFACGTSYPRFTLDDAAHDNAQLPFCEIYCTYYEPRIYSGSPAEYEKIEKYIDEGVKNNQTLQLFTHPHYISGKVADPEPALRALDHALTYVKKKKINAWLTAPQALTKWWFDRALCSSEYKTDGFIFDNPTNRSFALILPDGINDVIVNKEKAKILKKHSRNYIILSPGISSVEFTES